MKTVSAISTIASLLFSVCAYAQQTPIKADDAIKQAKEYAEANAVKCAPGDKIRKPDDVDYYINQNKALQEKLAKSMELYSSGRIGRGEAINQMNSIIREISALFTWGNDRVTNTCGSTSSAQKIGKSIDTTNLLIVRYKGLLKVK